jgi:hypothetical protein
MITCTVSVFTSVFPELELNEMAEVPGKHITQPVLRLLEQI